MCLKEMEKIPEKKIVHNQMCIVSVNRFGFRQYIRYKSFILEDGRYLVVCDDLGISFIVSDPEEIVDTVLSENDRIFDSIVAKIVDPEVSDLRIDGKRYRMDIVAPHRVRKDIGSNESTISFRDSSK